MHGDLPVPAVDDLFYQVQARSMVLAFCGHALLKDPRKDVVADAAAGILTGDNTDLRTAVDAEDDLPGLLIPGAAGIGRGKLFYGVFQQISYDRDIFILGQDQVPLQHATVRLHREPDPQLRRMHHLSDDQCADPGYADHIRGVADCLAGDQAAVRDKAFCLLDLPGLEIAEDDVELVQEFVVESPERVHHVPRTGKLVGKLQRLRAVLKNDQHAVGLPAAGVQRHFTDDHGAVPDVAGVGLDGFALLHDSVKMRLGKHLFQLPAGDDLIVLTDQIPGGKVRKKDLSAAVRGDQAL